MSNGIVLTRLLGWLAHDASHVGIYPTWTACIDDEARVLTREYGGNGVYTGFADTVALTLITKARGQLLLLLYSLLSDDQLLHFKTTISRQVATHHVVIGDLLDIFVCFCISETSCVVLAVNLQLRTRG